MSVVVSVNTKSDTARADNVTWFARGASGTPVKSARW
jgi:hypothetical protein